MRNFIPLTEVEKTLEAMKDRIAKEVLNAIEKPMNTEETAKFLGYKTRRSFQNESSKYPRHKVGGRIYCFPSELNNFIKNKSED